MIYSVSYSGEDGADGAKGDQGVSVTNVIPEYRLSDSSTSLTGSGTGYTWSETKPEIGTGQYIWSRQKNQLSDGTTVYSNAVCDVVMSGVVFDVDKIDRQITAKVWESDIRSEINTYDNSTAQAIRDRVTQTEADIDGITSTVSSVQSTLSTKADGSTVSALESRVSTAEQDLSGFRTTVESTYATAADMNYHNIFIPGTQTGVTGSWTGTTNLISTLRDGQQITYWLPYNGSGNATLNLTLSGGNQTGAIPCYYNGVTRLTTHYAAGNAIRLIYRENVTIGTTTIAAGWWADANYDTNNVDRVRYNGQVKAVEDLPRYSVIVGTSSGYYALNSGHSFGVDYPILYLPDGAVNLNATTTSGYTVFPASITTTQAIDLTPGLPLYIKGQLSGTTFTPVSTTPITQTIPTSEDNYHYMFLGTAYGTSTTTRAFYLLSEHPIYVYKSGIGFVKVETAAMTIAEQTADGFKWIVQSGTNSTNFTLTDRTAELVSNYINLNGTVTFNGLNSAAQKKITDAQDAADEANDAIALIKIRNIVTTYGTSSSATTQPTSWQTTVPAWQNGVFIWQKTVVTADDGTTSTDIVCLTGQQGEKGDTGLGIASIVPYYLLGTSTKPTSTPLTDTTNWKTAPPAYTSGKVYWTCDLITYDDSTTAVTEVVEHKGLNQAISTANSAASTATTAKNTADAASATANDALDAATEASGTATETQAALSQYLDETDLIIGTQVEATGAFTGNCKFTTLTDGRQITYWLPFAGSGNATLNLTFPDGTKTGAKNVYYGGTTRLTTHYPAGSIIKMTYRNSVVIGGTTYQGWWCDANYDSGNTYDRIKYSQPIHAGASGVVSGNIIVGKDGLYYNLKTGASFDITYPILYCGTTLEAAATGTNNYLVLPFTVTTTQALTMTPYKPVYIKGTLNGSLFTPASTTPLTQTLPTQNDNYQYMKLGTAYSSSGMYLTEDHDIYQWYKDGFKSQQQIAVEAGLAADAAQATANTAQSWITGTGATAVSMIKKWTNGAVSDTTTIQGGWIATNTITANQLATNAIMSANYNDLSGSNFSATGSFLDLSNGNFKTPWFGVNSVGAFFNGTIYATGGYLGEDANNGWNIASIVNPDGDTIATLQATGKSAIITGEYGSNKYRNWTIRDNRINTYNAGHYIEDSSGVYWDYGMAAPTRGSATNPNTDTTFLYIRKNTHENEDTGNSPVDTEANWQYVFKVDRDGYIYENDGAGNLIKLQDKYAVVSGVTGTYLPLSGGTITGNLTVNGTLTGIASSAVRTESSLSVNGKSFNGSAPVDVGTMGVAYGGTGKASWTANRLIYSSSASALSELAAGTSGQILKSNGSSAPGWVNQNTIAAGSAINDADGNAIKTTYRKLDNNEFDTINVTNLTAGNIVATGAARFTNMIYGSLTGDVTGNLVGTASNATKVGNNLVIKLNSGTTEGTNMFTFNGSAAKNINITKSSVGLGNVDNTADANKNVASAGKLTSPVNISIGSTSKSVDFSGDVEWTLAEIGAQPAGSYVAKTGDTMTGNLKVSGTTPAITIYNTGSGDAELILERGGANKADWKIMNTSGGLFKIRHNYTTVEGDWFDVLTLNYNSGAATFRSSVTATSFVGNASSATTATSAGKISAARSFTIGKTSKNVDWSTAVSFTQAEIADNATNTTAGWMSSDDKQKLDSITISDIGSVGANSIIGEKDITVNIVNGVATVGHSNTAITAGTASGTSGGGTVAFGGTVTLPSVTYDAYGHITAKGTTTFKLPAAPTTITGNAGTATKLQNAVNISVGDVTKSFDGSAAISFPTKDMGIIRNDLNPVGTKTYTGLIGTSSNNTANDSFYFMKLRPSDFYTQWHFHYRIRCTIPGKTNFVTTSDVHLFGTGQANAPHYRTYNQIYSVGYRPMYYNNFYRVTSTGFTNGYANAVGVGLRGSNERATSGYERTIVIEVLEYEGCSYEFLENAIKWADWAGNTTTNYVGVSEFNGCDNGVNITGDRNNYDRTLNTYTHLTAGAGGMMQYSLVMEDANGTWQSFTTTHGAGTSKTRNTTGFKLGRIYYMNSGSNYAAGSANGSSVVYSYMPAINITYSINSGNTLQANKPLWIVGTMNNGLFYLDSVWWTQTAPTSADGKVYIPIGVVYNSTSTSTAAYQIDFMSWQGAYYHDGTNFVPYFEAATAVTATNATTASSVQWDNVANKPIILSAVSGALNTEGWKTLGGRSNGAKLTVAYNSVAADWNSGTYSSSLLFGASDTKGMLDISYITPVVTFAGASVSTSTDDAPHWYFKITGTTATSYNLDNFVRRSGDSFTGAVSGDYIVANKTNSGVRGGLALCYTDPGAYGVALRATSNLGKHGYVQSDYATYFNMSGTAANIATKGWIFRDAFNAKGVASISCAGNAVFDGSVTVGGNTANTSGVRLEYNETLQSLDFIFN